MTILCYSKHNADEFIFPVMCVYETITTGKDNSDSFAQWVPISSSFRRPFSLSVLIKSR